MPGRIFVTGYGIISCIGNHAPATLEALKQGRSGSGRIRHIDTILSEDLWVGEVPATTSGLAEMAGFGSVDNYSRNALLGLIAAREAYDHARLGENRHLRTGLLSATTVGGMDLSELYYTDFLTNNSRNGCIATYDCADSTEKIAVALDLDAFVTTLSTACSSAANALMTGARLIRTGRLDRVLAGGCESLTKFHLLGFNALKILDPNPCRPFDRGRSGINLGEGAAYLVLESEESLAITGNTPLCEMAGWGNACEAYHQTASAPDGIGAYLAMEKALAMSGLEPHQISYINAHGTGTDNNDLSEGRAIEKLFGAHIPPVSSTKPFTGHTTSAAGSIEAILSIMALREGVIWPNLNFSEPMEELSFQPVKEMITGVEHSAVMSNSFGFGGNDTSLIFIP